uniref:Cytochrome P450 n=1 Tax=Arion vulgaris TaxID=1028688 RepID=A0A0B7BIS2_9EUPU
MELTTLLLAVVVFLIVYFWFRRPASDLPPSPSYRLPIVGHLFHISHDSRSTFRKWRQQYGDIYSLYMGETYVVVLNGFNMIKETLVKKGDVCSDRPPFYGDQHCGIPEKGIIFSSGQDWKEQRSVSLSILRTFGMGKNLLAEKIHDEVGNYINYLSSLKGKVTDIRMITNISTSNIICSILLGQRFEYDNKKFQNLMHILGCIVTDQQNVSLLNFVPWLGKIPGDFFMAKKVTSNVRTIIDMMETLIESKKRNIEDSSEVCNLIDAYINERNKKIQAGISTYMDDKNLSKIMFDLFVAGTETTSTTIYWCILYILHNPEVQEKVYQEIKDKVGTDRTPTMQDKNQLTYLNAVIHETQRLGSIVPLSVTHKCTEDITVGGYNIPKGTSIIPNLDSVLHDKTTWGDDVMSFKPQRFIDNNGKLNVPEQFIPFSIGRRVCLGEGIAKMELFLFLSSMFQKFQFLPPTPNSIPPLHYECGAVISPKAYEVKVVERI